MTPMEFMRERAAQPHIFGVNDCWMTVADWVVEATGADPATDWRRSYKSFRQAASRVKTLGGMKEILRGLPMLKEFPGDQAQPGDIASAMLQIVPVGAVCVAPDLWAAKTEWAGVMVFAAAPDPVFRPVRAQ